MTEPPNVFSLSHCSFAPGPYSLLSSQATASSLVGGPPPYLRLAVAAMKSSEFPPGSPVIELPTSTTRVSV